MNARIDLAPVPPRAAIEFFRSKGLAPPEGRYSHLDTFRQQHARGFVVAKAMRDDVLTTIRKRVDEAIAEGRTLDDFRSALEPELKRLGWWGKGTMRDPKTKRLETVQLGSPHRLRVIFDANIRAAYSAGRWQRIQQTKEAFPWLEYRQVQRPTKRDEHARYNRIVLPVDHPVWRRIMPPNGWFCGCFVRQISGRMLAREGLTVDDDFALETVPYRNPRTGEIVQVPEGIDPVWSSNPGMDWLDTERAFDRVGGAASRAVGLAERAASDEVRLFGLRDGRERLILIDEDDGAELAMNAGKERSVGYSKAMVPLLADPSRKISAIHNHPSSSALSSADFEELARLPALQGVIALGHDGSLYRYRKTTSTQPGLGRRASDASAALLQEMFARGAIDRDEGQALWAHLANLALANHGHVEYTFHLEAATRERLRRFEAALPTMVEEVERRAGFR